MRCFALIVMAISFINVATAQNGSDSSNTRDITCTFADGTGMRVQYDHSEKVNRGGLPNGKAWTPAGKPMLLFLDTAITVGGTPIPLGAYALYIIPSRADWTLVVSSDTMGGAKRDTSKDLAKTNMPTGELSGGENIATIFLAHVSDKECNIRVVYGKTMAWGEIHQK
jgi:hypothetical protein